MKYFGVDLPALTAARLSGLNYRTVHRLYELLRQRVVELALQEGQQFAGEVKIDESYFGSRRVRGKRGRGASGKTPVIGLHKRGHHVYVSVIKNCSKRELWPIIAGRVLEGSDVYTDGWKAYTGLVPGGYHHYRIHHQNEFARGKTTSTASKAFGASPNSAPQTPRRPRRSLPPSRKVNGASIIASPPFSPSSSKTSALIPSQLHETLSN